MAATTVRVYRGKQESDAVTVFSEDAEDLASHGYSPASKTWEPGKWGSQAYLLPLGLGGFAFWMLLAADEGLKTGRVTPAQAGSNMLPILLLVLTGVVVWAVGYSLLRPDGTLTVIYERRLESMAVPAVAAPPANPPPPQASYAATPGSAGVAGGREEPPQPPGEAFKLGLWEVVESASDHIRRDERVSVSVDSQVVAVAAASVSSAIPLKDAAVEIENGRLCLSDGAVRRFELVPTEGQDLGRTLEAIRERQAPEPRDEPSVAPAVTATPASPAPPPASDGPAQQIEARLATLKRLRATGAISEEEYGARRNKILDEV
jgi:hypothetical protein